MLMSTSISLHTGRPESFKTPLLACFLGTGESLPANLKDLDKLLGGALKRTLTRRDFRGARDETLHLVGAGSGPGRIVLVGIGSPKYRTAGLRRAATLTGRMAQKSGVGSLTIVANGMSAEEVEQVAVGVQFGSWEYADLKTPPPENERRDPLTACDLLVDDAKVMAAAVKAGVAIGEGYALARRLGNMPGNVCTPDTFVETAKTIGTAHKMRVTVLGRKEMERQGMGAFLAVAQGTPQDPKLITLEHLKGPKSQKPIVLVGKGLCFDSGGISIKPADRMEFMKFDMCGAAAVLGAMEAIGRLGLRINVIGAIGSTTNMLSGTAVKPGDVVTAASGKTIEVINTDAEGRLVLADVLHYIKQFSPSAVVDAATLTGACVVALGSVASGALGNDDALVQEVVTAARAASEPAWQLPLFDEYQELIRSSFADIKNIGGRGAGAITAAAFLKEFVDYPWVHLDVAGTAYTEADLPTMPVGSTGTPVGTFVEFVRRRAG